MNDFEINESCKNKLGILEYVGLQCQKFVQGFRGEGFLAFLLLMKLVLILNLTDSSKDTLPSW